MVFPLARSIALNRLSGGGAYGKRGIAFLPCKCQPSDFTMDPQRSGFLQVAQHVCQTVRSLQADEQMHVVGGAADALRETTETRYCAAQIFVQACPPGGRDQRFSVLRCEHQMVMNAEIG